MNKILTANDRKKIEKIDNRAVQVLLGAYLILKKPKRWAKGSFARDANQISTSASNPDAICFCALGAVDRAQLELHDTFDLASIRAKEQLNASTKSLSKRKYDSVIDLNDDPVSKRADVLRVFARAIKRKTRGRLLLPEAL